jgi:GNAT superfamily N-acetyltransferase
VSDLLASGYTIRHPALADLDAVYAAIVASEIAEFGESQGYVIDELEGDWKLLDLGRDAWVAIAPDGALVGYGYVQDRRHVRLDIEVYVHPEHTGRRIGTTLVRRAEARAREHVPLAPPGTRVVLNNWINALNAEARSLLEREGYAPVRYFFRMETEFSEEPAASSWPAGIAVRRGGVDEDLRSFYETSEEAMADHWGTCRDPLRSGASDARGRTLTPVSGSWPWMGKSRRGRSCAAFPMASVGSTPSWCADPGAGAGSASPC